ncbi:aldo/keto reductase [Corynebacterium durum]|uniref:aldo/keto reductase n=1 Tax=Corynebacterium durum TaxID=61592 RepID=UPI0028E8FADE|nr:aldo/keto reductase [Corynebacterium durum]
MEIIENRSWTYSYLRGTIDAMTFSSSSSDASIHHLGSLNTSPLGFGCMGLSQGYGATDDNESIAAVHTAINSGVTMFDTAMSYGQGHNEELVGRAIATSGVDRDDLQIATKFGIVRGENGVHLDAHPSRIARYCEDSLRRLGTDVIDLYYLHRVDPQVPIEDSIAAMANLVEQGKVRHIGVSEVTSDELRRASAVHPIAAVQMEWSLMWREPETNIVPTARELGVGLVPYSPLGRGLLGGRLDTTTVPESPFRANDPRFIGANLDENMRQVDALASLAKTWSMTIAQVALAWLIAQGDDVVPIPGTRKSSRVLENVAAMHNHFNSADLTALEDAVPTSKWVGDRQSFAVPITTRPTY